jgi:hypothetical protein
MLLEVRSFPPKGVKHLRSLVGVISQTLESQPARLASRLWPEVAGEQLAARTWVSSVRGDTMYVVVSSSVWAHQLQLMERDLVGRLRARAGKDCPVHRLRFRTGGQPPTSEVGEGHGAPAPAGPSGLALAEVPAEVAAAAAAAAREAGDDDLTRALERALRAQASPFQPEKEVGSTPDAKR